MTSLIVIGAAKYDLKIVLKPIMGGEKWLVFKKKAKP